MIEQKYTNFRILEFVDKPKEVDGKLTEETWVKFCPPGMADRSVTEVRVKDFEKVIEPEANAPAQWHANWEKAQIILEAYQRWQQGKKIVPDKDGTPLSVWTRLSADIVKAFHARGIHTIEEIANMNEIAMTNAKMMNIRELRAQAKQFLKSHDANKAQAEMEARDKEIAELKEQVAALMGAKKTTKQQAKKAG